MNPLIHLIPFVLIDVAVRNRVTWILQFNALWMSQEQEARIWTDLFTWVISRRLIGSAIYRYVCLLLISKHSGFFVTLLFYTWIFDLDLSFLIHVIKAFSLYRSTVWSLGWSHITTGDETRYKSAKWQCRKWMWKFFTRTGESEFFQLYKQFSARS